MKKVMRLVLALFCTFSFAGVVYFINDYRAYRERTVQESRLKVREITRDAAGEIDAVLQGAVIAANSIAGDFTGGKLGLPGMKERLREILEQNPYFYSGAITYKPYGYDPNRRLYSSYYVKDGQKLKYLQLDRFYDYTEPGYEWYGLAVEKGAHWSEPYRDRAAGVLMTRELDTPTGKVLGFCAGLFFVVVFSHIGIRQKISAEEVFYLEYFYFIMYLALLWVSVNSLLLSLAKNLKIIQYKDSLITKLVYWPVILGLCAIITLITFY
jgi:hypothetical protein